MLYWEVDPKKLLVVKNGFPSYLSSFPRVLEDLKASPVEFLTDFFLKLGEWSGYEIT